MACHPFCKSGATSTIKVKVLSLKVNLNKPYITDNQLY